MIRTFVSLALCSSLCLAAAQELPKQVSGGPGKPLSPAAAQKLFRLPEACASSWSPPSRRSKAPSRWPSTRTAGSGSSRCATIPTARARASRRRAASSVLEDQDGDGFFETSRDLRRRAALRQRPAAAGRTASSSPRRRTSSTCATPTATARPTSARCSTRASPPRTRSSASAIRSSASTAGSTSPTACAAARSSAAGEATPSRSTSAAWTSASTSLTTGHEAISGMGQFGNTFDDWGHRFVCDNRHHLRHVVLENRYLKRNPFLAVPAVRARTSPCWTTARSPPAARSIRSARTGRRRRCTTAASPRRAASSSTAATCLPEDYRGAAFTCDPTGNLVHQEIARRRTGRRSRRSRRAQGRRVPGLAGRLVPPGVPGARAGRCAVRRGHVPGRHRASRVHAAGAEEPPRPDAAARTRAASGASCPRSTS